MKTIAASQIKRRGIGVVDDDLRAGPVHVIKNDRLRYVILDEAQYRALLEAQEEAEVSRVRESLADRQAGRAHRTTAQELIDELGLED